MIIFMKDLRTGCDIVHIPRFKKIISRTPSMRRRIFLPQEEKDASPERLAGIFAAKEAVMKALGISAGRWHDIKVSYKKGGKPYINLSKNVRRKYGVDISIAHDGEYAIAFVVFYE